MRILALVAPAALLVTIGVAVPLAGDSVALVQRLEAKQTLTYGRHRLQSVDYWPGRAVSAPLVVFVHGGAWSMGDKKMMEGSDKLRHWRSLGYAVASVNYRLVPEVTVEQQAQDVAAAVALLKSRAGALRFDAARIALVGHSAGAHLVALVGTDPAYVRAAGLTFEDIAGVVPLDGAAYDVAAQLEDGPRMMQRLYRQAFGSEPGRHARLSPTAQAGAPNAARFLILHVQREDGVRQSAMLAAELRRAGTAVEVQGFAGSGMRGHAEINRRMGDPEYPATPVLDRFLARIFA